MRWHICSIYVQRPDWCREYPWNEANDLFDCCIYYDKEKKELVPYEVMLQTKTEKELQEECMSCGRCCFYCENGIPLVACSALQIVNK